MLSINYLYGSDYYPFGMGMPGRVSNSRYNYGFNGQEVVSDIKELGVHNTALFWEFDTRLSRRWNLDPIDQVNISNYSANGLNPILYNDPNGDLFGITGFGSTSEQRTAAKAFSKEHNGEILGLFKKSISVSYESRESLILPTGNSDLPFVVSILAEDRHQHFNSDGSLYDERPSIRQYEPTRMEIWKNSEGFIGQTSYSIANSIYTLPQLFTQPITGTFYNLDGSEQKKGSDELISNFISGVTSFAPTPTSHAKAFIPSIGKLNAAEFSKLFKGTMFSSMKPSSRGSLNRALNNNIITPINGTISKFNIYISSGQPAIDGIDLIPSNDKK